MPELLFWPVLLAYGEAAVAYVGVLKRPEVATRLAIWGVRVGWLVQTALLVAQAADAEGFPWSSWAGLLNLFVWLVVGAYLIWGCSPRYRLLGLAVMPLVVALFALAGAGGGAGGGSATGSTAFLALHVGLVLAGFAGFTLSAALSGLYLWEEQRLKRRASGLLRLGAPSLATLDALAGRTALAGLVVFTAGLLAGFARVGGAGFDAAMAVAVVASLVYAAFLLLRYEVGWRGRRSAFLALGSFAFVLALALDLPVHLS
jgi:ABC-type uncharacterized transport system permease subunit